MIYSEAGAVKGCFDLPCVRGCRQWVREGELTSLVVVLSYYEGKEGGRDEQANREGTALRIKNPWAPQRFFLAQSIGGQVHPFAIHWKSIIPESGSLRELGGCKSN